MTKPNWADIKAAYVDGTLTLAEVQERYNVRRGTLSARATRELWHDEKQQFAAKLEKARRENTIAKRVAEQEQFENNILAVARGQLAVIAQRTKDGSADVVKLVNALEKVQRIGCNAYGKAGS
jgi:hypothetical protein